MKQRKEVINLKIKIGKLLNKNGIHRGFSNNSGYYYLRDDEKYFYISWNDPFWLNSTVEIERTRNIDRIYNILIKNGYKDITKADHLIKINVS